MVSKGYLLAFLFLSSGCDSETTILRRSKQYRNSKTEVMSTAATSQFNDWWTTEMRNGLVTSVSSEPNGPLIKNIMIFQAAGWSGLGTVATIQPTSPLRTGVDGYLNKSRARYLEQMEDISNLSSSVAIAVLIMPEVENIASGYGATSFNGLPKATNLVDKNPLHSPRDLFVEVKKAAQTKGVQVAPLFSINNFECIALSSACHSDPGSTMLSKLNELMLWFKQLPIDATTLKNIYGKPVILTEGAIAGMTQEQRFELIRYLNTQLDYVIIDNMVLTTAPESINPENVGPNLYLSAATVDATGDIQDKIKSKWGNRYRWHYLEKFGRTPSELQVMPDSLQNKWLNISPFESFRFPVIISQWNEYSEFLVFEPTTLFGNRDYLNLKFKLALQGGGVSYSQASSQSSSPTATTQNVNSPSITTSEVSANAPVKSYIKKLYERLLKREPDAPGLDYWVQSYTSNQWTCTNLAEALINANDETKSQVFSQRSNADFVSQAYNILLARPADTSGSNYWTEVLQTGQNTRQTVIASFISSIEFKTNCQNAGLKAQ